MALNRFSINRILGLFALLLLCVGVARSVFSENINEPDRADLTLRTRATVAEGEPVAGRLLRVPLPITGNVDRRVIAEIQHLVGQLQSEPSAAGRRSVLVLEFDPGASQFGLGSVFEDSLKLARFLISPALDGVKTVAYLPRSIGGHALLAAMACDQIVMAPDAVIGNAGAGHDLDHPIDKTILSGYQQISKSRHTVPIELAVAMLDDKRRLLRVKTDEGTQLVFASQLAKLQQTRTIDQDDTTVIFPGGQPAFLAGDQARKLGVAAHLASDREELARYLGISRQSIQIDPLRAGTLKPRMILVDRYINPRFVETRLAMMNDAIENDGVNLLCLWIDCKGGDLGAIAQLTAYLAERDATEVFTVAYIPGAATGTAALIALACDDIIMQPNAVIGGGEKSLSPEEQADIDSTITDVIIPNTVRSSALTLAMFKKNFPVYQFRNRRTNLVRYFNEAEFIQLNDQQDWERGEQITTPGKPLQLTGIEAENVDIATAIVDDFVGLKRKYGLLDDPALVEPNWVDQLIGALASPGLGWLLVLIGMAGIYAEVQMPGIGVGGFLATVAFALYFWANFMNHTATELEIILFIVGVSCLILEVFIIPGFGIFGLGGGIMILVSLILASQTFVLPRSDSDLQQLRDSLLIVGGAVVALVLFSFVFRRYLPNAPILSRLMLPATDARQRQQRRDESPLDGSQLLGQIGRTTTQLTPSGKASFANELVDVISDAELIPEGTDVEVVEVHGGHVLVRAVES